ncbi:hypothetical protein BKP57_14625 [Virgibacillus sp. 6R]|uniref:N-acetyltransferase domain-containing protein n=3 Tax=Bacillaceae TaxID=186817 RepID=A0A0L0QJV0_VIRPA|nr:hypothetical protein BKP57_14625 [Virgibacillus sp. 6R]KNE18831.1 hypothetical protein AFK71_09565 [Virgibacillus pantothenticus]
MYMEFTIRRATIKDKTDIINILQAAARWLQNKGIKQWGFLLAGNEDPAMEVEILAGNTYIAEIEGQIAGTFIASCEQNEWDVLMWGEKDDAAWYIHRLAVHQNYRGKQIGRQLLEWIETQLVGANSVLRLDCVADNPDLISFYDRAGYTFVGMKKDGEDRFALYEKELTI